MSEGQIAAMLASIAESDERMTGMLLDANVPGLPQASFPARALSDRSSFCWNVVCFLESLGVSKLAMCAQESLNQMLQVD